MSSVLADMSGLLAAASQAVYPVGQQSDACRIRNRAAKWWHAIAITDIYASNDDRSRGIARRNNPRIRQPEITGLWRRVASSGIRECRCVSEINIDPGRPGGLMTLCTVRVQIRARALAKVGSTVARVRHRRQGFGIRR